MISRSWRSLCLVLLLFLAFAFFAGGLSAVCASPSLSPQQIREARQDGHIKSLRWVLRQIKPQYPGRLLDVELKKHQKIGYVYKVKILQENGHIIKLYIDANSAEVLRVKRKD